MENKTEMIRKCKYRNRNGKWKKYMKQKEKTKKLMGGLKLGEGCFIWDSK